jgi:hypothetical protein
VPIATSSADAGVARLTATFPLAERLASVPDEVRRSHRMILDTYLTKGEPPAAATIDPAHLAALSEIDAVVLRDGEIVGAYPFTSEGTSHGVQVDETIVGAMCSIDALAVGPVFGVESVVYSMCAVTHAPIRIADGAQAADEILVGVHFQDPSSCAASSLCRDMVFLVGDEAAAAWRDADPDARELFALGDAIEFAERFFAPVVG